MLKTYPEAGTSDFEDIGGDPLENEALEEIFDEKADASDLATKLSNTSGEAILASASVSTNVGTKQALYTVPAGKAAVILRVVLRNSTGDLSGLEAGGSVGFNAGASDVVTVSKNDLTILSATQFSPLPTSAGAKLGASGDVLGIIFEDVTVTGTVQVEIFGYLYVP